MITIYIRNFGFITASENQLMELIYLLNSVAECNEKSGFPMTAEAAKQLSNDIYTAIMNRNAQ